MNAAGAAFTLLAALSVLLLPRTLAAIPLLMGAAYMTCGQTLELGSAHYTVVRLLVMAGMFRVIVRGERLGGGFNRLDGLLLLWASWLIGSSAFQATDTWMFRSGIAFTHLGGYFLFRVFIHNSEEILRVFKILYFVFVPVTLLMLLEKYTGRNFFADFGGVNALSDVRNGHVRAQGPFAHAILAGTVGAGCVPLVVCFWPKQPKIALLGLFSAGGIVFASTSSGPIMMDIFVLLGLALWRLRAHLPKIRWLALAAVVALDMAMKDPVYFLMARIDISGGSTGWHRAQLIRSSIEHLDEWWMAGTGQTRHWMATGIYANGNSTDITNEFLWMGVMGGLLLIALFIVVLAAAFGRVSAALRENAEAPAEQRFLIWTLGAVLFGHIANFFSVSYFDESTIFFYLLIASISALAAAPRPVASEYRYARTVTAKVRGNGAAQTSGGR